MIMDESGQQYVYVCMDADDVGAKIELMLLDENIDEAAEVAESVRKGMKSLRAAISNSPESELLMSGCDDVIVRIEANVDIEALVAELRTAFYSTTGFSLTAGIGVSIRDALESLRRGKLMGKNQVVRSPTANDLGSTGAFKPKPMVSSEKRSE